MSNKKKLILLSVWLAALVVIGYWAHDILSNETTELVQQERLSQIEADQYLLEVAQQTREEATQSETPNIPTPDEPTTPDDESATSQSDFDYEDNVLYSTHSVKEAWGHVDCVIEIPAIQLRQCVFTGTPQQLTHDLACWLAVTCRSDYVLGQTHYSIYMHNPRNKTIRISYAQTDMQVGDYIVITKGNIVYLYEVTGLFAEWREICTEKYADDMTVSNKMLYIFTCGRDEWQGRNTVIEGTIYKTYHLNDWNEYREEYLKEYHGDIEPKITETVKLETKSLNMDVVARQESVKVTITTPDNIQATNCSVGLFDSEGFLITDPIPYNGYPISIDIKNEGEFTVGIYQNDTEYSIPTPFTLQVSKEIKTITITSVDEYEEVQVGSMDQFRNIAMVILGVSYLALAIEFIITIFNIVKSKKEAK